MNNFQELPFPMVVSLSRGRFCYSVTSEVRSRIGTHKLAVPTIINTQERNFTNISVLNVESIDPFGFDIKLKATMAVGKV